MSLPSGWLTLKLVKWNPSKGTLPVSRLIQKLIIPADQRRPKPLQKKGFKFGPSVARVSASIES
jgi:hypothetical protein